MANYYGDFPVNALVYIPLSTFDSNDPSASVTVTNLLNTDVHIHKDGAAASQRNNAAGITMTIDFDTITGNHLLVIDTSDNTVADFYQAGHEYQVRVEGITVDGATINAWVGSFSIERAGGALALLKNATYGLAALEALVDDIGVAGAGLTSIPWNAAWDAEVQSEAQDAITASALATAAAVADVPTFAEFEARTLAAASYATPTNITAGTITTVTTVTNAPTGMALEATLTAMKGATFSGSTDSLEAIRNQGDAAWVTGTGWSTHSAADVWSVGARTLTAGTNIALAKGTGITGFNDIDAAAVTAAVPTAAAIADAVWDEIIAGHAGAGSTGATLSAASAPSAAAVADAVWDEVLAGHAGVGSAGAALSAAGSAGDPWTTPLPGAYGAGTAGYLIGHMDQLGAGAVTWTYTLTDSVTGGPIASAEVWVTTDSAGSNVIASGTTNASGVVTFYLDAGTVYVWRQRPGYNFVNPSQETVA